MPPTPHPIPPSSSTAPRRSSSSQPCRLALAIISTSYCTHYYRNKEPAAWGFCFIGDYNLNVHTTTAHSIWTGRWPRSICSCCLACAPTLTACCSLRIWTCAQRPVLCKGPLTRPDVGINASRGRRCPPPCQVHICRPRRPPAPARPWPAVLLPLRPHTPLHACRWCMTAQVDWVRHESQAGGQCMRQRPACPPTPAGHCAPAWPAS